MCFSQDSDDTLGVVQLYTYSNCDKTVTVNLGKKSILGKV